MCYLMYLLEVISDGWWLQMDEGLHSTQQINTNFPVYFCVSMKVTMSQLQHKLLTQQLFSTVYLSSRRCNAWRHSRELKVVSLYNLSSLGVFEKQKPQQFQSKNFDDTTFFLLKHRILSHTSSLSSTSSKPTEWCGNANDPELQPPKSRPSNENN